MIKKRVHSEESKERMRLAHQARRERRAAYAAEEKAYWEPLKAEVPIENIGAMLAKYKADGHPEAELSNCLGRREFWLIKV